MRYDFGDSPGPQPVLHEYVSTPHPGLIKAALVPGKVGITKVHFRVPECVSLK